jgi:hypothetical protein
MARDSRLTPPLHQYPANKAGTPALPIAKILNVLRHRKEID